jgi:hypothetical protein
VERFETKVERGGGFVVIGLYYFMELQGGRGSREVLWLHNKACQQWLVLDELVWEWNYSAS